MTLVEYLKESNINQIEDDSAFCEAEHDAIAEYLLSNEVSENDIGEVESRGYEVSYFRSE